MRTPGGDKLKNGICELKSSFLKKHHQGDGGDWFGHGINTENGIGGHCRVPRNVHLAQGCRKRGDATALDQYLTAGNLFWGQVSILKMGA